MIEGDELPEAVGIQYPWQQHPSRSQKHSLRIPAFYIDRYPVTNRQYKAFMDATHYRPADDHHFLKDWSQGSYPTGWENKPVTWVSIEDARAYAVWAGKRLPHEWEWQYAGQGNTASSANPRLYPWGDRPDPSRTPPPDTGRSRRPPPDVNAFPAGASPFGVMGMVGNVWQWTDEYTDAHTRSAILKGGSYYHPQGSQWYFPKAQELNKYGKYLLLSPGTDRAGTIGFRCVMDNAEFN
jgi:formylglycine-generating enzyme required for sulfatase activity